MEEGPPTKRSRLEPAEDNPFDEAYRKNATDLLSLTTDETGNLEARIHMVFSRLGGTRRLNLEMSEHRNKHRFVVILGSKVLDKLSPFPFHAGDIVCVSLKGAEIARRPDSSAPFYLPVAVKFNDGLAVMLMSGPESGKVFNTWEVDWFDATLDIPRVTDIVMHDASAEGVKLANTSPDPSKFAQIPRPETVVSEKPPEVSVPVLVSHEHRNPPPAAVISQSDVRQKGKEPTKAQKRRRKKKAQEMGGPAVQAFLEARPELSGREMMAPQTEIVPPRAPSFPPTIARSPRNVPSNELASSTSGQTGSLSSGQSTPGMVTKSSLPLTNDPTRNCRQGALAMKAGLVTQGGDEFSALRDLVMPGLINIIGVVVSIRHLRQTSTNEWTRGFSLVDPSCMEDDMDVVFRSFTVNCFQKKHTEWLPQAEIGDIVIFRRLKAAMFSGSLIGVGYDDKLRWATYDPNTRRFRAPDRKDAPHSEEMDEGFGYSFSPFYEPPAQGKEAEYCAQMADWWQALQANKQGVKSVQCVAPRSREHHLISEVTPDTAPQGYFDCTVEILHGFENTDGPYTMYVTDYTTNPHTFPVEANWCPPELSRYVFRMEMWDKAALLARTMQPGELWYLVNSRMMAKTYFEGKLVEVHKSKKLEETQSDENPYLRALLERKKKYEKGGGTSGSSTKFDDKLIEDVDEDVKFFSCTVEVLHVDLTSAEEPLAYVTDYTFHPALASPPSPAPWTLGLDRRIVKVVLEGGQKGRARDLQPGTIHRIKNLRLIRRTGVNGVFGRLGGDERLIIETKDREKEEVKALLQRKEQWKMEMKRDGLSIESTGDSPTTSRLPPPATSENLTLTQVIASTVCPNKFTFVARVTDFNPLFLDEATFLRCSKCKTELRPNWKRCIDCDDMLETHCKWLYGLFFRLEDDEGNHIIVSVSGKECKLLSGLPPTDLQADKDALDRFVTRLKPVIGNLMEVHDAYLKKENLPIISPKMCFTVESWNAEGRRGYGLLECTPL